MNYLPDSSGSKQEIGWSPQVESIQELEFVELSNNQKFVLNYLLQFILDQKLYDQSNLQEKVSLENRKLAIAHFEKSDTEKILDIVDRVSTYVKADESKLEESEFNQEYLNIFRTKLINTINQKKDN